MQADVTKVIEFREGPEELTKAEIDAKLLNWLLSYHVLRLFY
jgi:hypothetical protein